MSVPGARASSILLESTDAAGRRREVVLGMARDPLLAAAGSTSAPPLVDDLMRKSEPALLDQLPIPGGTVRADDGGIVSSAMVIPLRPSMTPAGLAIVYGHSPFSSEDLRYLSLLCAHAAICLDNAAMTERLARSNEHLEAQVRERTAELRIANEELRELDRMKDRFLSSVSHEMKTPLTAIVSGSELLGTIVPEEDPAREFVALIDHQARQLTSTVDRIMRFQVLGRTRVESGASAIDPLAIVRSVARDLSDKAAAREIGIAVDLPERAGGILGDGEALGLALKEILDNAVKFAPRTSVVTVSARETLVTWTRPVAPSSSAAAGAPPACGREVPGEEGDGDEEMFVIFSVRDTGPGIPLEDQTRIFEKFEQLGDLLTSKPDGLGLGLPLAREIARRHGGDLFVQSEADGTEFRLYVPVRPHPPRASGGGAVMEAAR